jgi:23S rRNA (uridine2552-2'-O)-methyltransferase
MLASGCLLLLGESRASHYLMRFTCPWLSSSSAGSSRAWLARQFRDPYVRLRLSHPSNYRSRSAFKLLELDSKWGGFLSRSDVNAVVDLGGAPGGWSQVVAEKLGWIAPPTRQEISAIGDGHSDWRKSAQLKTSGKGAGVGLLSRSWSGSSTWNPSAAGSVEEETPKGDEEPLQRKGRGTILSIDLLPIQPIPGVRTLQRDFLHSSTAPFLTSLLPDGLADVVLSDMAPNMSGNRVGDEERGREICEAVWEFAKRTLRKAEEEGSRRRGVLLCVDACIATSRFPQVTKACCIHRMKHHHSPLLERFRKEILSPHFYNVHFIKPQASRKSSSEGYFLCRGYRGDRG